MSKITNNNLKKVKKLAHKSIVNLAFSGLHLIIEDNFNFHDWEI